MSPRERSHPVDASRATQHDNTSAYRAGYTDARRRMTAGGRKPPRSGCPIKLLLLPLALVAALWRHRHPGGPR